MQRQINRLFSVLISSKRFNLLTSDQTNRQSHGHNCGCANLNSPKSVPPHLAPSNAANIIFSKITVPGERTKINFLSGKKQQSGHFEAAADQEWLRARLFTVH